VHVREVVALVLVQVQVQAVAVVASHRYWDGPQGNLLIIKQRKPSTVDSQRLVI
jgi:hypothetical protein